MARDGLVQPDLTPAPLPGDISRPANIRGGNVTSIDNETLFVRNDIDGEMRWLLTSNTVRDEGFWTGDLPVEVGDRVLARGATRSDGSLMVTDLWINSSNCLGLVLEVLQPQANEIARFRQRDRYDLTPWHDQHPEGHVVALDPRTIVAGRVPRIDGTPMPGKLPQWLAGDTPFSVQAGQYLEVFGREYHGVLIAVRAVLS